MRGRGKFREGGGTAAKSGNTFRRAPLASEAVGALAEISSVYSNLEFDLTTGERSRRGGYVQIGLALLCQAEAATVVNNCAAALVLIVRHFTTSNRRARPPGAP